MISKGFKLTFATILMFLGLFVAFTINHNFDEGHIIAIIEYVLTFFMLIGIIFSFCKNKKLLLTGKIFLTITSILLFIIFLFAICKCDFPLYSQTAKCIILILSMILSIITFILSVTKESKKDEEIEFTSTTRTKTFIGNILLCCLFALAGIFSFIVIIDGLNSIASFNSISQGVNLTVSGNITFLIICCLVSIIGFVFTLVNFNNYKYTNDAYKQYKANTILSFVCAIIVSLCSLYYIFANGTTALAVFVAVISILGLVTGSVLFMIDFYNIVGKNQIAENNQTVKTGSSTTKTLSTPPQQTKETFETKLANLYKLKKAGALTDEEFETLKKKLIEKNFK